MRGGKEVVIMKFTKFLALILAILCCVSVFAACDGESSGLEDLDIYEGENPVTPLEKLQYAYKYAHEHPYKRYTHSTATVEILDMDPVVSETIYFMDNGNYYTNDEGRDTTFHNGVMYVSSTNGKKKAIVSEAGYGEMIDEITVLAKTAIEDLREEDITMTAVDGGYVLEFSVQITYVYDYTMSYVTTLDKNNHIISETVVTEALIMGYNYRYVDEMTYEYGDQYKVSAPADADEYELVDSLTDLF